MGISDITSSMKTAAIVLALALGVSCDTLGGHSHGHGHGLRQGRQEEALGAYGQPQYGDDLDTAASDASDPLAMLQSAVPGVPGEDYPIYAEVPETAFSCDGQVDGGYYADGEAECQVFHICTADGAGGLAKYSFLCPNGTLFNQNYFICDWWFNFDCATAEELYSLNDEIAAQRDALAGASDQAEYGASSQDAYAAPAPAPPAYDDYVAAPAYDEYTGSDGADYYDDAALGGYEAETEAPVGDYLPPGDARRGRSQRGGRRGGSRRGRNQRNQRRPGRRPFRG